MSVIQDTKASHVIPEVQDTGGLTSQVRDGDVKECLYFAKPLAFFNTVYTHCSDKRLTKLFVTIHL